MSAMAPVNVVLTDDRYDDLVLGPFTQGVVQYAGSQVIVDAASGTHIAWSVAGLWTCQEYDLGYARAHIQPANLVRVWRVVVGAPITEEADSVTPVVFADGLDEGRAREYLQTVTRDHGHRHVWLESQVIGPWVRTP